MHTLYTTVYLSPGTISGRDLQSVKGRGKGASVQRQVFSRSGVKVYVRVFNGMHVKCTLAAHTCTRTLLMHVQGK